MRILVTGCAGFIGHSLSARLLTKHHEILGLDCLSDYYSLVTKHRRLNKLSMRENFRFKPINICDDTLAEAMLDFAPEVVIHLAAQPGVRLPIDNFDRYVRNNIQAFCNIALESVKQEIPYFLYASSSSVYGHTSDRFMSERSTALNPTSFYGSTKLTNEFLAKTLAIGSKTKFRGLRFFTVYGPEGRPDMAYSRIIGASLFGFPFYLNGDGTIERDFTYIDDVVIMVEGLLKELEEKKYGFNDVVNVGGGNPVSLNSLISCVENLVGNRVNAIKIEKDPKDVQRTCASFDYLRELLGDHNFVNIDTGMKRSIEEARSLGEEEYRIFLGLDREKRR